MSSTNASLQDDINFLLKRLVALPSAKKPKSFSNITDLWNFTRDININYLKMNTSQSGGKGVRNLHMEGESMENLMYYIRNFFIFV
jgi:hypothetical protein